MNGDEIVRYIVTETLMAAGNAPQADVDQLVSRFLREFGGTRVYLPLNDRQVLMQTRERIFAAAVTSSKPTGVLLRDEGISRSTLYRLLKKRGAAR